MGRVFLPTRRLRHFSGTRGAILNPAAARLAAERAAAEALGVPVVVSHPHHRTTVLARSGRSGELKQYSVEVFRTEAHPRFAQEVQLARPHTWLAGHESQSGEYRPLSMISMKVIDHLIEAKLVPGRHQLASTVLMTRGTDDHQEYLMRMNPKWGYFFPSKRRGDSESAAATAQRVVHDELGLEPGRTATLTQVSDGPLTYHDQSESAGIPTFYVHTVFEASLQACGQPASDRGLVWVPLADILGGQARSPKGVSGAAAEAGRISRTAIRVLEFASHC